MKVIVGNDAVTLDLDLVPLMDIAANWLSGQWKAFLDDLLALFTTPSPIVRKVCDLDNDRWFYEVPLGGRKNFTFTYYLRQEGHEKAVTREEYQKQAHGLPGFFQRRGVLVPLHVVIP